MQNQHVLLCRRFATCALAVLFSLTFEASAQVPGDPAVPVTLKMQPAEQSSAATHAPILGATSVGKHIVGVGDYGIVLLSDDDGKSFHQAASVPVSSTLTAVSFVDEKNGWAVGHWGVILNTTDGGEHWAVQRVDTQVDRPLFSVYFFDAQEGIAVGLWSLMLTTHDGGKTWATSTLPVPPDGGKTDRNLFKAFASPKGSLFISAERGLVLRSDDRGKTWQYIVTGYKGSFWSGLALKGGTLLVAGLRGTIYRSADDGHTWQAVNSGVQSSITDMVQVGDKVVAVGLDGVQVSSADEGATFNSTQREDRLSMNAAAVGNGSAALVVFSQKGIVPASQPGNADKK